MFDESCVGVKKYCHLGLCKRLVTLTGQGVGRHSIFIGTDKQTYGLKNDFQIEDVY